MGMFDVGGWGGGALNKERGGRWRYDSLDLFCKTLPFCDLRTWKCYIFLHTFLQFPN